MHHGELTIVDTLISTLATGSPYVQPLTVQYAKDHIRALNAAEDDLIEVWIQAAASYFEEQTGRQLITATREAWLDAFPFVGLSGAHARIELPRPPLQAVLAVEYVDGDGVLQSFDDGGSPVSAYWTSSAPSGDYAKRGYVEPIYGNVWPTARDETGAVRIRYRCGYGDTADDMPALVRGILCYLVGHFDTFRSAVHEAQRGQPLELPFGVKAMMDGFKRSAQSSQVLRRHYHTYRGADLP